MIINKHIKVPLYSGYLGVLISDNKLKISEYYDTLNEDLELNYAHTFNVNVKKNKKHRRCYLVAFNVKNEYSKITHGVIAHEAFHAADAILSIHGLELTNESSEAYSYLVQWITDEVYKVLIKNNIIIHLNQI